MADVLPNSLYYGDCLDWMRQWPSELVDLIYLDPPFNSNANYNILFGKGNGVSAQMRGFTDTWKWNEAAAERVARIEKATAHPVHDATEAFKRLLGESGMLAYLTYMGERLAVMRDLLKPTGSIYLHCDPTASHYLKALMDSIFGGKHFRNEIAWCYTGPSSPNMMQYPRKHDYILFYTNNADRKWTWNQPRIPHDPSLRLRSDWGEDADEKRKAYLARGKPLESWWTDVIPLMRNNKERIGYPTQKPVALLERIIKASSDPGDLVLDPFCGCGTTVVAAHNLGRRWLGIDISPIAIDLINTQRLRPLGIETTIHGIPQDLEGARRLAADQPFKFEEWAVTRIDGLVPNERQTGDGGIDGRGKLLARPDTHDSDLVLAQVTGAQGFSLDKFRGFLHVVERENAAAGVYITLERGGSDAARAEARQKGEIVVGAGRYPRVQIWSLADYFAGHWPQLPTLADPYTGKAVQSRLG